MRFIWPVAGAISRDFYYKSSIYIGGQHAAVDIPAVTGTPIKDAADGKVKGVGWDIYSGFFVAIDHADNWTTRYRHLYGQSPVAVGQRVTQGQVIGNVGSTGWSTGPHLHFDLWHRQKLDAKAFYKNGLWAHDPELYLGKEDGMAFTSEQKQEIRDIIFDGPFIAKDAQGDNSSEPHDLEHWMGILIEHLHAPHGAGGADLEAVRVLITEEIKKLQVILSLTSR